MLSPDFLEINLKSRERGHVALPNFVKLGQGLAENEILKGQGEVGLLFILETKGDVSFEVGITERPSHRVQQFKIVQQPTITIGTYASFLAHHLANGINQVIEEYFPCFGGFLS